ncbi:MAG: hypothetical protein GY722_00805 [bacterium]|nr:hypothetical protein [bacterium]
MKYFVDARILLAAMLVFASPGVAAVGVSVANTNPDELYWIPSLEADPVLVGQLSVDDIFGLAFDEDFVLYGVSSGIDSLVVIDATDAQVSVVGSLGFDVGRAGGLTFDPNGVLWLVSDNQVYIVDSQTGSAQLQGVVSGQGEIHGLTACGGYFPVLIEDAGQAGIARLNMETLTLEAALYYDPHFSEFPAGLDWNGNDLYAINNRTSPIGTPDPTTVGSFLHRFSYNAIPLGEARLMGARSLAFASGPPLSKCPLSSIEVPTLSRGSMLGLALLLALAGIAMVKRMSGSSSSGQS